MKVIDNNKRFIHHQPLIGLRVYSPSPVFRVTGKTVLSLMPRLGTAAVSLSIAVLLCANFATANLTITPSTIAKETINGSVKGNGNVAIAGINIQATKIGGTNDPSFITTDLGGNYFLFSAALGLGVLLLGYWLPRESRLPVS